MKINLSKFVGILLLSNGIFFILNSSLKITGYVIAGEIGKSIFPILGLMFILGGIIMFMSSLDDKINFFPSGKATLIEMTENFKESIKARPEKPIADSINQIVAELSNKKYSKYEKGKKIINTKNGEVEYEITDKKLTLHKYKPKSKPFNQIQIVWTKEFERSIGKQDLKKIKSSLDKLRAGKGSKRPLKNELGKIFSINVGKGDRITYTLGGNKAYLKKYFPSSKHDSDYGKRKK